MVPWARAPNEAHPASDLLHPVAEECPQYRHAARVQLTERGAPSVVRYTAPAPGVTPSAARLEPEAWLSALSALGVDLRR